MNLCMKWLRINKERCGLGIYDVHIWQILDRWFTYQHDLAIIGEKGEQPYSYCSHYNTKKAYISTYVCDIIPLDICEKWILQKNRWRDKILPLTSKRPPWRPKNSKRRMKFESINPTMYRRWRGKGHNKRMCNYPLPLCHLRKFKHESGMNSWYG